MLRAFSWYWSSSVKMNGAGIRLPSHALKPIEPVTMTASHAQTGTRRSLSTKLDLGQTSRQLRRLRRVRLDPDVCSRCRDVAEKRVRDRLAARRLFECRDVQIRRTAEVVVAPDELEARLAHPRTRPLVPGQQLERRVEGVGLLLVDRHLQGDVVRQLDEPADVADDDRPPVRELADDAAGRLSHRRRAQVDADVACRHQRPEPVLLDIRLPQDALAGQPEPLQAPVEIEAGGDGADEEKSRVWAVASQPGKRLEQLRDPLARVD